MPLATDDGAAPFGMIPFFKGEGPVSFKSSLHVGDGGWFDSAPFSRGAEPYFEDVGNVDDGTVADANAEVLMGAVVMLSIPL